MTSGRIERCYTDNIYLIESFMPDSEFKRKYLIMGNSGNTYMVTITNIPKCTCPDYNIRHNRCKHIYFVLIRIMKINNYHSKQFSDDELNKMFKNIPEIAQNLRYNGEKSTEEKGVNQKFDKGDICPICLDDLENGKELDYCRYSCGKTIHKKCFSMWKKSKGGICVFCRAAWHTDKPSSKLKKVEMHPIEVIQNKQEDNNGNQNNKEHNNSKEKKEEKKDIKKNTEKRKNKKIDKNKKKKNIGIKGKIMEKRIKVEYDGVYIYERSRSRSRSKNRKKKKLNEW